MIGALPLSEGFHHDGEYTVLAEIFEVQLWDK